MKRISQKENDHELLQFYDIDNVPGKCDLVMHFWKHPYRDENGETIMYYEFRGSDSDCKKYNEWL